MAAVTTGARMAHAQLARLEAEGKLDEGLRYEILHGELVIRGAPAARHGEVISVLAGHLIGWVRQHGGRVVSGVGIEIDAHQLIPDLSFVGPDRADLVDPDGFHVPPDLVVEVTSPGTRSLDLHEKRGIYEALGVGEYWVIDLARDVLVVHRLDPAGAYAVTEHTEGTATPRPAPGLDVPVAELLADSPGKGAGLRSG